MKKVETEIDGADDSKQKLQQLPRSRAIEIRYLVCSLLCLANALCYACRMNIGIAIPYIVEDKGSRGLILSSFFYGYIITQIPAGYWSSKIGVKWVLAVGVFVWTICDAFTILVYKSLPLLILVRAAMGCGQGVVMSSLHIFAASWYPLSEQTTLVAFASSGTDIGTITALLVSPLLIKISEGKWQVIFVVFSTLTMFWLVFYLRNVTSKPEQHHCITPREKEMIISTRQQQPKSTIAKSIPWTTFLSHPNLWVIYISHFCANYSWYVLLGWLPTYVHEQLGLDLKENNNQIFAASPYVCGYIGLLSAGKLSDYLITHCGVRTLLVRRCMNSIGSFIPALLLFVLPYSKTSVQAIWILSGALFFGRACTSGFWINMIDVGADYAGQIMGVSNAIGTIPGIVGNLITGYILQKTQSWTTVFHVAAFVCFIGGIIFALGSTDRNIFDKHKTEIADEEDQTNEKERFLSP